MKKDMLGAALFVFVLAALLESFALSSQAESRPLQTRKNNLHQTIFGAVYLNDVTNA